MRTNELHKVKELFISFTVIENLIDTIKCIDEIFQLENASNMKYYGQNTAD